MPGSEPDELSLGYNLSNLKKVLAATGYSVWQMFRPNRHRNPRLYVGLLIAISTTYLHAVAMKSWEAENTTMATDHLRIWHQGKEEMAWNPDNMSPLHQGVKKTALKPGALNPLKPWAYPLYMWPLAAVSTGSSMYAFWQTLDSDSDNSKAWRVFRPGWYRNPILLRRFRIGAMVGAAALYLEAKTLKAENSTRSDNHFKRSHQKEEETALEE